MNIIDYIKTHKVYLDGAMGSMLQEKGFLDSKDTERLNITHPDIITDIHTSYFNAGSNIINTHTFGANSLKYNEQELDEIIKAAVTNAKKARDKAISNNNPQWIALDIGPTGRMLAPYGDLSFDEAVNTFAQTITLGVKYGVDLIYIETMNDSYETKAAVLAAKENCNLPVFVTNSYGEDGKLMTGASPEAMVAMLEGLRVDAIGVNCSFGPKALEPIIMKYIENTSIPIILKPNAGLPQVINGQTVYDINETDFAQHISSIIEKGVNIVGGCCGTTPNYIKELVNECTGAIMQPFMPKSKTVVSSYTHAIEFDKTPILIGERINPTGKKLFKEALKNNDIDYILNEGIKQQEAGVHILDVNVGLPEIDEVSMLKKVILELQAIINLPLQIDTSNVDALEVALRYYNGKPLINSVNGKQESMDAVFPLAQKYGGVIIALTLDEQGIPAEAKDRLVIADKIIKEAQKYGIERKDLIFDPLAMAISADPHAGVETLKAIDMLTHLLICKTSLGVSNVSFGLPKRDIINASYFTQALSKGLSTAIINPFSNEIMKAYYSYLVLNGLDNNCKQYIDYAENLETLEASKIQTVGNTTTLNNTGSTINNSNLNNNSTNISNDNINNCSTSNNQNNNYTPLMRSIIKGLKNEAATYTKELLETTQALDIINKEIIPGLDIIGDEFENKRKYLPQLLMSAEAAKAAFNVIKENTSTEYSIKKASFVLATVKGDIHDIGKNIVKLLLENYSYEVIDLGKDVSPEDIVKETVNHYAPFVGLSALMTTTVPSMAETIKQLKEKAPWCKIIVGGAVLTKEYALEIGANYYAKDALDTVKYCENTLQKNKEKD
ncbi:MAG: homocysteine methyltransferase [Lachnospiraceae bacterium]|nr:homocysteine methyltransferase [Lachnospiraceae bacterium]